MPRRGQVFYRDSALCGFALRVTAGSMSYIVECRVNGTNRRITIGPHGPLTPEAVRKEAQKLLAQMKTGRDPKVEEANCKLAKITIAEVLEDYLASRPLRENTVRNFRQILTRCTGDWLDKPIAGISKEMVVARHRELTKITKFGTSGKAQANGNTMEKLGILFNFAAANYEINGLSIIQSNPVSRLSQIRSWHRIPRRQTVIPDHKLAAWYQAVLGLRRKVVRDYLLLLLFSGLRRNEAATLRWSDVDFESKVLKVRAEVAKNHREYLLPLGSFLLALLRNRKLHSGNSDFVFPGQGGRHHLVDSGCAISKVIDRSGVKFTLHDLRRVFLTTAEKLNVPHYVLKKLVNHVSSSDVTAGYIVVDVERLRSYMELISAYFVDRLGASEADLESPEHGRR